MIGDEEPEKYERAPKFDEDPEDIAQDWRNEEILLAALGHDEQAIKQPLVFGGVCKDQAVKILVDGGSTLNLVSTHICDKLELQVEVVPPVPIKLPNGEVTYASKKCSDFSWKMNSLIFNAEVWVLDLSDWGLIMGVQWLAQLGEMQCNYGNQPSGLSGKESRLLLVQNLAGN